MTLTPDDVRAQVFANARKGYSEMDVDAFLDAVVAALEERDDDIQRLRGQLEKKPAADNGSQTALAAASQSATQLLIVAQTTADECVAAGKKEAEETVRRAQQQADESVRHSRQEAEGILEAARAFAAEAIQETETRRREVLGSLMYEQQRLQQEISEAVVSREQVRADLERYLTGVLSKISERPANGTSSVRALRA